MNGPPSDLAYPPGDLRSIVLHWTAGDYHTTYPAYHVCVALDEAGVPAVHMTADLRGNMRDVRGSDSPYAAHTSGRNSYAIGLAICGMRDATPHDFGTFALRGDLVALACNVAAGLCRAYAIPVDAAHVYTHAEAAIEDGYFGAGDDERWDGARLLPSPLPLEPADAVATGEELRRRVREAMDDAVIAR